MPVQIFGGNKLTRSPFFLALIEFLREEKSLREIHKAFEDTRNLDRQLDQLISAGLVIRSEKRYRLGFPIFTDGDFKLEPTALAPSRLSYDGPIFIEAGSRLAERLSQSLIYQTLTNETNSVKLHFISRFDHGTENLFNYFYKLEKELPLSPFEEEVYQILGDVDPEYCLKYMTTFLLRFLKKESINVSRPDIFVRTLEKYGMIEKTGEKSYMLKQSFQAEEELPVQTFTDPKAFIQAQLAQQQTSVHDYLSIGG
ncbi:DUF1803 domain-containing protein [Lactococcus termiticola]|uniref:DUF1803 domain-containing protein n=1 Tax=Lactococcus termiticola TaxID=2169526 RepID=A0A2R5HFZ2_9LACT|nr:DUF1803 domain-containing protein [Lactococcus termiticola]GBG96934.1 hypothetical protein NtB2_01070 [Lactococcus termiticola]